MRIILYILFIIKISLFLSFDNPAALPSNYPFSYKKDNSMSIIFMEDSITLFDVTQILNNLEPLDPHPISSCISREEKGGIYLNNYYYTSCLKSDDFNSFKIKVYDENFNIYKTFPDDYYHFSSGTIRFFKKNTSPELLGVVWIDNGQFNIIKMDHDSVKQHKKYPVSNMARDTDCIFITKHDRIVCLLGIEKEGKYTCSANLFTYNEYDDDIFVSNLKSWFVCTNHLSRKIRADTSRDADSDIFYYYFIDTNYDAYIIKMKLLNTVEITLGPVLKVMSGCDENQHSYDMAEDTFMGFYVFICVENRFKKKIKIQLFKIEDDKIIFYENKSVHNPFEFDDEFNSEISMINFVVLKDSLNFGILSYRTDTKPFDYYTIFNQPECSDFEISMMGGDLYQNKFIDLDFNPVIKNDNYDGGKIEIVSDNPGIGMKLEVLPPGTLVKFKSKDYITGDLEFTFRVINSFYVSENCKAIIRVKNCFQNCETCSAEGFDFYIQKCEGCKKGNYPIINFPKDYNDNCCQTGIDCPDYLYLDIDEYKLCDISCLACNGGSENNCVTCYNLNELRKKYSLREQDYINEIKHETINTWFYWENAEHKKCVNSDEEPFIYLDKDEDEWTYLPCYKSCLKCRGKGTPIHNNCSLCYEDSNYFHFESRSSENCLDKDDVPHNYYLYEGDYIPGESTQSRYWTQCYSLCYSCRGGSSNDCTNCTIDSFPKCDEKELNHFECFKDLSESNYFFDIEKKCYEKCDTNCLTCDKRPDELINNCLSCDGGKILFNRNCYDNCPKTHYELDHRYCVSECPDYSLVKITNIGAYNEFNQCFNCAEIDKCIYLGTANTDPTLKLDCISCVLDQTFISNEEYGILEDCYNLCDTCTQRGTVTKMNCINCKNPSHCLVEDYGNCVDRGTVVDYYYMEADGSNCVYHKCYTTCKLCSGEGDSIHHNCLLCKNNYQFDINNSGNCVILCKLYWYIDINTQELICVNEEKCPDVYPYLIQLTKECVQNCVNNHYSGLNNYGSTPINFFRFKDTCLLKCPSNTMEDNINYACYPLDDVQDVFNYATNYINFYSYNYESVNNLLIYSSDRKMYFHLFNTTELGLETYSNLSINVGTSISNFSECLETMRVEYGYDNEEIFYIGILDIIRDDTSSSQIEYIIHDHIGTKLNNEYCLDKKISINKSLIHSNDTFIARDTLEIYGIDVTNYNSKNSFFCDICLLFDYNPLDPYDVLLNDRYKYYYQKPDYYFCENTCDSDSTKIYLENNRVQCICKGKNSFTSYNKEKFHKFSKSSQICKDWFMQYLKCYKNVFSKDLFRNNIGHYLILFLILFQILTILLLFLISRKPIMRHIREIFLKKSKNGYIKEDIELGNEIEINRKGSKASLSHKSDTKNKEKIDSQSNDKINKVGNENGNKIEDKKSNKSGSTSKTLSQKEGKNNNKRDIYINSQNDSFSEGKNKNSNPPKKPERNNYKFTSDENIKENNDIYNSNANTKYITPNDINNKNKDEQKINKIENKGAPKPISQRYARRFIQNRKDYIDNSYREESYDFDLSKIPKDKRKIIEDEEDNEEGEEEGEKENENKDENEEKNNNEGKEDEKVKDDNKSNKKSDKLSAEALAAKKEKEEFKEEIRRFKKLKFIELYWFILKKRHRIISLFIKKDVYDIFSIKLSLLILSYTIDIFITTLFFFDFEIRFLFHEKKHIDLYYIIFMGLIDTLTSTVLMRVIDFLIEFRKKFKKFEREEKFEKNKNYYDLLNNTVNSLTRKIIIYYSINFGFSLCVWYIVSAFIGTYRYTKLTWGIIIGFNFVLSNIFPFIYYLIIVSLQYNGIHNKRFKLFKFAMIMLKI